MSSTTRGVAVSATLIITFAVLCAALTTGVRQSFGLFLAGVLFTLPAWSRRGARNWWQANQGQPPHPETTYAPSTIPQIRRRK